MKDQKASSASLAREGWQVLWPSELRRKQAIYKFGLEKLMRFEEELLRGFFVEFLVYLINNGMDSLQIHLVLKN